MTLIGAGFETGTNGATIATTDAGDPTAWTTVTINTGCTATYDSTHAHAGGLSGKFAQTTATSGSQCFGQWSAAVTGTLTDAYGRLYLYFDSAVGTFATNLIAQGFDTTPSIAWQVRLSKVAGVNQYKLSVFDGPGSLSATGTVIMATDQWVRIEWHVVANATTGSIEAKLFNTADSATADDTVTLTNCNTRANLGLCKYGIISPNILWTGWFDDIVWGAAAYPGPRTFTNAYLATNAADAGVTVGSGTLKKALSTLPPGTSTLANVNAVTGNTAGVQFTDSTTAGTNGTAMSWYTEPLSAVTIAGQIVWTMFGRESATSANAAPAIKIERCSGDGTVLSTIVAVSPSQGATEFATTAGGATKTGTITAGNVTDTTLTDGDRLRLSMWIDDAVDQGGTGTMASGGNCQIWYGARTSGAAGLASITFTEALTPYTSTGSAQALAGQSDGVAAAAGDLSVAHALAGTSGGAGAATGALAVAHALAGQADGTGGASGLLGFLLPLAGSAAGTSTATGALTVAHALTGTASGTSTATGDLAVAHSLAGTAAGAATAVGALVVTHPLAGQADGASTATGALTVAHSLAGTATGTSTATGDLAVAHALAGSASGTSTATGALAVDHTLAGTAAGTSSATGALAVAHSLTGQADGSSAPSGALAVAHSLAGTSAGVGGATGALTVVSSGGLAGQADGVGGASGALSVAHALTGTAGGTGGASGALAVAHSLVGQSDGTSAATGSLRAAVALAGTTTGTGGASGALTATLALAGQASGAGGASGALAVARPLQGATTAGTGGASGTLSVTRGLSGTAAGSSTATGQLSLSVALAGQADGTSSAVAALALLLVLAAYADGYGDASGDLTVRRIHRLADPMHTGVVPAAPHSATVPAIGRVGIVPAADRSNA